LPGGRRYYKFVWTDGKPPKYWVALGSAFLAFSFAWVMLEIFFWRLGQTAPDSIHSSFRLHEGKLYHFPTLVLWLQDFGLFVVMAWMFVLAAIMAFYRKLVPGNS
jgi:hypothetical protein